MSFEDFAQLCGVSVPSPVSNGHSMFYFIKKIFLFIIKNV